MEIPPDKSGIIADVEECANLFFLVLKYGAPEKYAVLENQKRSSSPVPAPLLYYPPEQFTGGYGKRSCLPQ